MKKIKNTTQVSKTWIGQVVEPESEYELQYYEIDKLANDPNFIQDLSDGNVILISDNNDELSLNTAIACLKNEYLSTVAVDLENTDVAIETDDWLEIEASRVIWDLHEDYDTETNNFMSPYDGIYFFDGEWKVTNLVNVTAVEVAIFKRLENGDDYWFILDKKLITAGQTEAQLSAATSFDFYEGDEYTVKIKLYGTSPSAAIEGDDDYTAWGYSFSKPLY